MEHYPFAEFDDGLTITSSDIKKDKTGHSYITLYFETPRDDGWFNSAQAIYPGGRITNIRGYSNSDVAMLQKHYDRLGDIAFDSAKEREKEEVPCLR